jgi:hypothetical protein
MTTTTTPITPAQSDGIAVRSALKAGKIYGQHNEGVVVRSAVKGGVGGSNHSEGVVVRSAVKAGADRLSLNHAEGVVVRSAVKAGNDALSLNHAEGVVVRSAVKAGGSFQNHAEDAVDAKFDPATADSGDADGVIIHEAKGDDSAAPPAAKPADEDALVIEF